QDLLSLAGARIVARQFATVDKVRIARVGRDITVFLCTDGLPIAKRNGAVWSATRNTNRAAFLLTTGEAIGERILRAHMVVVRGHRVELRGRLVVPLPPGRVTVDGDDGALIAAKQDNLRIVRADPDVLIIIAARRSAPSLPALSAVD